MQKILQGRNERKFSIVVTVNLTKQILNQTLKINCKVLLVPTKFLKMLLQQFWINMTQKIVVKLQEVTKNQT